MYKKETIAAAVCGLLALFILLVTSTQALCFWIPGWWRNEYTKYDTPQYVRGEMSMDDAVFVTEQMLEYCIGRLDSLDGVEATIDGVKAPFFTEREKLHLADCRQLFLAGVRARIIALLLLAVLLVAIRVSTDKKNKTADPSLAGHTVSYACILAKGYLYALTVTAVLSLVIALIGLNDFTFLFTEFHHVFFDNDLWLLYPDKDNLINIMQEAVFADAALTIAGMWIAASAIPAVLSIAVLKRARTD